MAFPEVTVEVAFPSRPFEAVDWVDVSEDVISFETQRGRSHELDRIQAGTANVVLENSTRTYDPKYVDGPHYPNVLPMRRLRILAEWDGVTYPLWAGYIEGWGLEYRSVDDAVVNVSAVDGFKILALKQIHDTFPEETSDERINRILNAVSWTTGQSWILDSPINSILGTSTILGPVGDRDISEGQSTIQAQVIDGDAALALAQAVEESENGLFFMGADGSARFFGRHRQFFPPYTVSQGIFGDEDGELRYESLSPIYDDSQIWNEVRVEREGGVEQVATDQPSIDDFGPRTLSRSSLVTTDNEAADASNYLLSRFRQPHLRFQSMTIAPEIDDALWPQVLGRDILDQILARRRPPGEGDPIEQVSNIEGIGHRWAANARWVTTWALRPADVSQFWVLDDPSLSLLGISTRLAY